ncbi:YfhO family protein [Patescibacteria group bacterium]|nr:YfhO family protein [Patescibacteria group bacterium]
MNVLIVGPHFLFRWQAGEVYGGFDMLGGDEYYYAARVREVYDGHLRIANPFLAEGKDLPYAQQPLPEIIMALTGRILRLEIGSALILFRFLGPTLLFFLIYSLVLSMTKGDKRLAILAPIVVIFASNLLSRPQELWQMISGSLQQMDFTMYSRLVNPQISSLFLFGFLYSFWKLVNSKFKRYWYYCLLIFGLSFYVYPYTWSFLLVFILLYLVISALKKERAAIKKTAVVLAGGLVIAIPYFINVFQMATQFSYEFLKNGQGMYKSREFVFGKLLLIIFFILCSLKSKFFNLGGLGTEKKKFLWYWLALALAGLAVVNQQIITGQMLWHGHYHYYIIKPLAVIMLVIFGWMVLRKLHLRKSIINILMGIIILVSFFNACYIQFYSYQSYFGEYLDFQKYGPVVKWLNENTDKDEVIYTSGGFWYPDVSSSARVLNRLMFVYTHLNVYYSAWVPYYLSPYPDHEYSWHNLFITLKLLNIEPDGMIKYLASNSGILGDVYGQYFVVRDVEFRDVSQKEKRQIDENYKEFYPGSWQEIFTKYPIDYILWDKNIAPNLPFEAIAKDENIAKVYDKGGIVVYEFLYED